MATELRRIIFSASEIIEAVAHFREVPDASLPSGEIIGCAVHQRFGNVTVVVDIDAIQDEKIRRFKLNPAFLSAALLEWCRRNRIPIPKRSTKYLEVVGDSLALNVTIEAATARFEGGIDIEAHED